MGELAHIKLFLEEATTDLIVSTWDAIRKVAGITTTKKALIEPGEILSVDGVFYKKRFKIKLSMSSEANMTSIINEIVEGCLAYSKRAAGYTYPAVMCHVKYVYSNKTYVKGETWLNDVYIDVEWCTS